MNFPQNSNNEISAQLILSNIQQQCSQNNNNINDDYHIDKEGNFYIEQNNPFLILEDQQKIILRGTLYSKKRYIPVVLFFFILVTSIFVCIFYYEKEKLLLIAPIGSFICLVLSCCWTCGFFKKSYIYYNILTRNFEIRAKKKLDISLDDIVKFEKEFRSDPKTAQALLVSVAYFLINKKGEKIEFCELCFSLRFPFYDCEKIFVDFVNFWRRKEQNQQLIPT